MPLDELEEESPAYVHRQGEDLEHLTPLVPVDEYPRVAQRVHRDVDRTQPAFQHVVVAGRGGGEADAPGGEGAHRGHDVGGVERDVLHAGTVVPVQEVVDLAAAPAYVG